MTVCWKFEGLHDFESIVCACPSAFLTAVRLILRVCISRDRLLTGQACLPVPDAPGIACAKEKHVGTRLNVCVHVCTCVTVHTYAKDLSWVQLTRPHALSGIGSECWLAG